MEIRPAASADLDAVAAIYAHHVATGLASFELEAPGLDEMASRFAAITAVGYPYLVAEEGGAVVGYAYASAFRPRPAYRFTVEDSIYLAPVAQRRGIGRALLVRLIEACEARGYRQMIAVIGNSANEGSIRVHRACGFGEPMVLAATGFKFGRWVDTVLMQRELGNGAGTPPD